MVFDESRNVYKNSRKTRAGDILSRAYVALEDIELSTSELFDILQYPFTRMYAHRESSSAPCKLRNIAEDFEKSNESTQLCWDAVCLGRSEEEVGNLSAERAAAIVNSGAKHYPVCKRLRLDGLGLTNPEFSNTETEVLNLYRTRLSVTDTTVTPVFVKMEKTCSRSTTHIQWVLNDSYPWWILERKSLCSVNHRDRRATIGDNQTASTVESLSTITQEVLQKPRQQGEEEVADKDRPKKGDGGSEKETGEEAKEDQVQPAEPDEERETGPDDEGEPQDEDQAPVQAEALPQEAQVQSEAQAPVQAVAQPQEAQVQSEPVRGQPAKPDDGGEAGPDDGGEAGPDDGGEAQAEAQPQAPVQAEAQAPAEASHSETQPEAQVQSEATHAEAQPQGQFQLEAQASAEATQDQAEVQTESNCAPQVQSEAQASAEATQAQAEVQAESNSAPQAQVQGEVQAPAEATQAEAKVQAESDSVPQAQVQSAEMDAVPETNREQEEGEKGKEGQVHPEAATNHEGDAEQDEEEETQVPAQTEEGPQTIPEDATTHEGDAERDEEEETQVPAQTEEGPQTMREGEAHVQAVADAAPETIVEDMTDADAEGERDDEEEVQVQTEEADQHEEEDQVQPIEPEHQQEEEEGAQVQTVEDDQHEEEDQVQPIEEEHQDEEEPEEEEQEEQDNVLPNNDQDEEEDQEKEEQNQPNEEDHVDEEVLGEGRADMSDDGTGSNIIHRLDPIKKSGDVTRKRLTLSNKGSQGRRKVRRVHDSSQSASPSSSSYHSESSESESWKPRAGKRSTERLTMSNARRRISDKDNDYETVDRELINLIDSMYIEYIANVTLSMIIKPNVDGNSFDWTHYNYVSHLLENGYITTRGVIVLYVDPEEVDVVLNQSGVSDLTNRTDLRGKLQVVDGVFRTLYLKKNRSHNTRLTVVIVRRKDGKSIPEADLLTYATRRNGISAQNKTPSTANLLKVASSAVQLLHRRQDTVASRSVTWFQYQICQTLGYPDKRRPAFRGVAEIAKQCIGKAEETEMMDTIMQVSPKIGISHLQVSNLLLHDIYVLRIYLLSLRKAFHPSLRGPRKRRGDKGNEQYIGDSQNLQDTSSRKTVKIRQMRHVQTEAFKDVARVVYLLRTFDNNDSRTVQDILNVPCKVNVRTTSDSTDDSNCLTTSYPLIDVITDEVGTWFCNRTFDRVKLLMSDIVKHINSDDEECVKEVDTELEERMKDLAQEYEDFIVSPSGKRVPNGTKDPKNPVPAQDDEEGERSCPQSPSEYGDDEIQEVGGSGVTEPVNSVRDAGELKSKLSDIQKRKALLLKKHRQLCAKNQLAASNDNNNNMNKDPIDAGSGGNDSSNSSNSQLPVPNSTDLTDLPKTHFYMDDEVPDDDPKGALLSSEREYQNSVSTGVPFSEVLKANVPVALWNSGTSTNVAIESWMESLFLKPGHRANMFLTHNVLLSMFKSVHDHIASRYLVDNVNSKRFVGDHLNKKQMTATLSFVQLRSMESELRERGWTCVPDCPFVKDSMDILDNFYQSCPAEVRGNPVWELIAQTEEESKNIEELSEGGSGRRMTSRFGVMELLEQSDGLEWKHRARLDVFIGIIMQGLGVATITDGVWDLFMPKTGGRPLASDPTTGPQQPHCDYGIDQTVVKSVVAQPGYFVMVAGKYGFTIWIAERSHIHRHTPGWRKKVDVKQVFVEPYSIFIGRGDLFHAGDKYNEKYNRDGAIRYHVLLCPDEGDFYNEIQYLKDTEYNWIPLQS